MGALAYLAAAGRLLGNSPEARAESAVRVIHERLRLDGCTEHCYWRFEHCPGLPCAAWRDRAAGASSREHKGAKDEK
jgi:hypothetical protein